MGPKIHKEGNPDCPVVSLVNSHSVNISKYVDSNFQPIVKEIPSYVKGTQDFLVTNCQLHKPHIYCKIYIYIYIYIFICSYIYTLQMSMEIQGANIAAGINSCFSYTTKYNMYFYHIAFLETCKTLDVLHGELKVTNVPFISFIKDDIKISWHNTTNSTEEDLLETLILGIEDFGWRGSFGMH